MQYLEIIGHFHCRMFDHIHPRRGEYVQKRFDGHICQLGRLGQGQLSLKPSKRRTKF